MSGLSGRPLYGAVEYKFAISVDAPKFFVSPVCDDDSGSPFCKFTTAILTLENEIIFRFERVLTMWTQFLFCHKKTVLVRGAKSLASVSPRIQKRYDSLLRPPLASGLPVSRTILFFVVVYPFGRRDLFLHPMRGFVKSRWFRSEWQSNRQFWFYFFLSFYEL